MNRPSKCKRATKTACTLLMFLKWKVVKCQWQRAEPPRLIETQMWTEKVEFSAASNTWLHCAKCFPFTVGQCSRLSPSFDLSLHSAPHIVEDASIQACSIMQVRTVIGETYFPPSFHICNVQLAIVSLQQADLKTASFSQSMLFSGGH